MAFAENWYELFIKTHHGHGHCLAKNHNLMHRIWFSKPVGRFYVINERGTSYINHWWPLMSMLIYDYIFSQLLGTTILDIYSEAWNLTKAVRQWMLQTQMCIFSVELLISCYGLNAKCVNKRTTERHKKGIFLENNKQSYISWSPKLGNLSLCCLEP